MDTKYLQMYSKYIQKYSKYIKKICKKQLYSFLTCHLFFLIYENDDSCIFED